MDYEFRVIVEKVSVADQKVVKRDTVKIYDINPPESILELGLRHEEQISLLSKIQSALLAEQTAIINLEDDICPLCGGKLSKNGFKQSKFHAVFSDHKLRIQKHRCKDPKCGWEDAPTITSVFGTHIHPDLAKIQCEAGAVNSYRDAVLNLEKWNAQRRSINNHDRVKHMTNQVGEKLSEENYNPPTEEELPLPAQELIVQIDGGHIPTKEKGKRSFEALSGVVYRPSAIEEIDKHHRRITDKSCVISALDDDLYTIKTYLHHAALKQGLCKETHITALADGAKNCWSSVLTLKTYCKTLVTILDWFHIGKKFQNVINALDESFRESLEKAKWSLWHGDADKALKKIALIRDNIQDEVKISKLNGLYDYLANNLEHLVDYEARKNAKQVFTSQVAESHIDTIINERHKRKQKMQWTREGAHNVMQIRASMESDEWDEQWLDIVMLSLQGAA